MNKKFCSRCTGATLYEDELPNVCSKCGQPFAGFTIAKIVEETPKTHSPQAERLNTRKRYQEPEKEDEEDEREYVNTEFETPEIELDDSRLKGLRRPTVTGKDLAFDNAPKEKIERPKLKKMNKKQLAESFKNDINRGGKKNPIEITGFSGD